MNNDEADIIFLKRYLSLLATEHSICVRKGGTQRRWKFTLGPSEIDIILADNSIESVIPCDKKMFQDGVDKLFQASKDFEDGKRVASLVYNLLFSIYQYTTQIQRQHYFHYLVDKYYEYLKHLLAEQKIKLKTIIPRVDFELLVRDLIPFAKLEVLYTLWKELDDNKDEIEIVSSELCEHFQHPNVSREECYQILRNKLGTSDYQFMNFHIKKLDERPGFLGDYFRLNITINFQNNWQVVHLFAKYLPTTLETSRAIAEESFKKELFFYQMLFPELKAAGYDHIPVVAPNCYFIRTNDVLIMEDISYQGYKSSEMTNSMSAELLLLAVKKLAQLHACGLLYERALSKKLGRTVNLGKYYKDYLEEIIFLKEGVSGEVMRIGARMIGSYLIPKCKDLIKNISYDDFIDKVQASVERIYQVVQPSDKFQNFIGHGDLWGGKSPETCLSKRY